MKKISLSLLFLSYLLVAFTQVSNVKRLEIEDSKDYYKLAVTPLGENGFVFHYRNNDKNKKTNEWEHKIDFYTTDLKLIKSEKVMITENRYEAKTYTDSSKNYTLYLRVSGEFSLLTIDGAKHSATKVDGLMPKKCTIIDMKIFNNQAFVIFNTPREKTLITIDCKTGLLKTISTAISGVNIEKVELKKLQVLAEDDEVLVYLTEKLSKKETLSYSIILDKNGKQKESFKIPQDEDHLPLEFSVYKMDEKNYVLSGTYKTGFRHWAEGVFFSKIKNGVATNTNYLKFTEMKNFFSYLTDKQEDKLEKKKEKLEKNGKELEMEFLVTLHDMIIREDGFVMLGESFFPTYRTEFYTTTTTVNGVTTTVTKTRQVFDGYQYSHAFIVKFDANGKKVWDQTFEMWLSHKPYFVKQFIRVTEDNTSNINMIFANASHIHSKSIKNTTGAILSDEKSTFIDSSLENDQIKYTISESEYWYDKYFIVFGEQKIKNTEDKSVDKKRYVDFVLKVKF
jgi:hypothetical protein